MLANVVAIFLIGLVAIVSPGPDFCLILRNSMRGTRDAFATVTGILAGCLLQITACVLGLSVLLTQHPSVFRGVRIAGAAYLIYLGLKGLRNVFRKTAPAQECEVALPVATSSFREGLLCNLLNPKFTVFVLSLFAQFTSSTTSLSERVLYGAVLWVQGVGYWYGLAYLLRAESVQRFVGRAGRVADSILGVLLTLLGARILWAA